MRRFLTHWLPLLLWMGVIFAASTELGAPQNTLRIIVPILRWLDPHISWQTIWRLHHLIRKSAHAVEYAILACLIWRVVRATLADYQPSRQIRLVILCAAFYAATDETHQIFVPGRGPAVTDVMLDTFGAALGLGFLWLFSRPWKKA
jgi:VanZ family protein